MNLSLLKLKKLIGKSGQGSLIAVALGGVLLSTLVASATSWYITMRKNIGNTEDKLEAQTIAISEWERLSHMSLDELEAKRSELAKPYSAGAGSQYQVSVNLGQKGTFNGGTCGAVSGGYANCFKDTTITVYRDGSRMFTTRTLPLMAGDYTRKEIDDLLANIKNDYTNKYNTLANRLNGKEFVKNKTPNYDLNFRYEKVEGDSELTLHAYNGNTEIDFGGKNSYGALDWNEVIAITWHDFRPSGYTEQDVAIKTTQGLFTAPCDGILYLTSTGVPRGVLRGQTYNPRDVPALRQSNGYYWINDHVGLSGAGYNFPLSKGETFRFYSDEWWWYFVPYKGQGFTRAKYLNGTWH